MKIPLLSIMIGIAIFVILCSVFKYFILVAIGLVLLSFVSAFFARAENYGYYKFEDEKINQLKQRIATVIPEVLKIQIFGSNESFTIDKKIAYICCKDEFDKYYPDNMLIYVILHELAHALCPDVDDHSDAWSRIFNELLVRAEKGGIYDSSIPLIFNYCGL